MNVSFAHITRTTQFAKSTMNESRVSNDQRAFPFLSFYAWTFSWDVTVARAREILSRNSLRASSSGKSAPRRRFANASWNFCHSQKLVSDRIISRSIIRERGVLRPATDAMARCRNVSPLRINAFAPLSYLGNCFARGNARGGISENDLWGKSEIAPWLLAANEVAPSPSNNIYVRNW